MLHTYKDSYEAEKPSPTPWIVIIIIEFIILMFVITQVIML